MALTVAIIGRPNVGKSTLFNRLVGRRQALVDDQPGVTRDRRIGRGRLGPLDLTLIDTAGLEDAAPDTLEGQMFQQTARALADADVGLFLVDARAGLTPHDRHFADWLRRQHKPIVLVANKAEARLAEAQIAEAYGLGLGDPILISAAHGEGLAELADALLPFAPEEAAPDAEADQPLSLAFVGRPNVGKSTLVNALLGQERVLTSPVPGTTRDAIEVDWLWQGRRIRLVDTAGLRRQARISEKLEKLSVEDTLRALDLAQVVVLVMDAAQILDKQDLTIAGRVVEEGRALVVALNKWDLVTDHKAALQRLRDRLETSLPQAKGVPTVTLSALHGQRLDRLMEAVVAIHEVWSRRIATGPLNRWLAAATEAHPPPLVSGHRLRLRYMTQIKSRPPTFALWTTRPADVPDSYQRYLVNGLRETFDLKGVPIRLKLRRTTNPYADKE